MAWIENNKEWLFSGIGISIAATLFSIIIISIGIRKVKFKIKIDATITNDEKSNIT
jgi:hypothetical protein